MALISVDNVSLCVRIQDKTQFWIRYMDESERKKFSEVTKDGKMYGIPIEELSYKQARAAYVFAIKTQPWLEENIGKLGVEWFVEVDREFDSLRLQFKDEETETYFKLAWMQRDHESD